jgi:hypothetical protein
MHPIQKPNIANAIVNLLLRQHLLNVSIVKVPTERTRGGIVADPLANRQLRVSKAQETLRRPLIRHHG